MGCSASSAASDAQVTSSTAPASGDAQGEISRLHAVLAQQRTRIEELEAEVEQHRATHALLEQILEGGDGAAVAAADAPQLPFEARRLHSLLVLQKEELSKTKSASTDCTTLRLELEALKAEMAELEALNTTLGDLVLEQKKEILTLENRKEKMLAKRLSTASLANLRRASTGSKPSPGRPYL